MLLCFAIVAVTSITEHHSVLFHYLMSMSLLTSLLTVSPLLTYPKPLIYNAVLVQFHIHQHPSSAAVLKNHKTE